MALLSTFTIEVQEQSDAETFRIFDRTDWTPDSGFTHTNLTAFTVSVVYDSTTYTYDALSDLSLASNFTNCCGAGDGAYLEVTPADLLNDGSPISTTHFVDGYYEITVDITYDTTDGSDDSIQGLLAHATGKSALLPLQLNLDNYDYEENRLQFMILAFLNSAGSAAEFGRQTQFETILSTINDFYDARDISDLW